MVELCSAIRLGMPTWVRVMPAVLALERDSCHCGTTVSAGVGGQGLLRAPLLLQCDG
jgi:hypothetical protein